MPKGCVSLRIDKGNTRILYFQYEHFQLGSCSLNYSEFRFAPSRYFVVHAITSAFFVRVCKKIIKISYLLLIRCTLEHIRFIIPHVLIDRHLLEPDSIQFLNYAKVAGGNMCRFKRVVKRRCIPVQIHFFFSLCFRKI